MKAIPHTHIALAALIALIPFAIAAQAAEGDFQVLSLHDVEAVFVGTHFALCKGKTALCPYQCGGSGVVATFAVQQYNAYECTSEWADEMADTVQFMLEATEGSTAFCPDAKVVAQDLLAGTRVHLVWQHVYPAADYEGAKIPARQVLRLELASDQP